MRLAAGVVVKAAAGLRVDAVSWGGWVEERSSWAGDFAGQTHLEIRARYYLKLSGSAVSQLWTGLSWLSSYNFQKFAPINPGLEPTSSSD